MPGLMLPSMHFLEQSLQIVRAHRCRTAAQTNVAVEQSWNIGFHAVRQANAPDYSARTRNLHGSVVRQCGPYAFKHGVGTVTISHFQYLGYSLRRHVPPRNRWHRIRMRYVGGRHGGSWK